MTTSLPLSHVKVKSFWISLAPFAPDGESSLLHPTPKASRNMDKNADVSRFMTSFLSLGSTGMSGTPY